MKVRSWAKLNLFLEVIAKRQDGYHNIETLIVPVSLFDEMEIAVAREMHVMFSPEIVPQNDNTILKAHHTLKKYARNLCNFRVRVKKRIPVFAGLGGGSSNAAAFVKAALQISRISLSKEKLLCVAQEIGSDVPFFFQRGMALCAGRGEIVTPVTARVPESFVIVDTTVKISTAKAYLAVDSTSYSRKSIDDFMKTGKPFNRFQEILKDISPELEKIRRRLSGKTGTEFFLTGSGGALYSMAETQSAAKRIATAVESEGLKAFTVRSLRRRPF